MVFDFIKSARRLSKNLSLAMLFNVICVLCAAPTASRASSVQTVTNDELLKGQVIEKVVCKADPQQSYSLFLPSSYSSSRKWPILYAFDPLARGQLPVKLFREAGEKFGFIVVGSNNSRNGIEFGSIVKALWLDTHERFAIDEQRVYTAGFSGGARVASWLALTTTGLVAGVIACSGGFPANLNQPSPGKFILFGTAGTDDFNFPEMQQLARKLKARGITHRLAIFEGDHDWPPVELCTEALSWMEVHAMKNGQRAQDASWLDKTFSAQLNAAHHQEDAGQIYEAYLNYEALADSFRGLRDVKELEASAARLGATKEVKAAVNKEREEEESQETLLIKFHGLLFQLKDAENSLNHMMELRSALSDLRKKSEDTKNVSERRVARRVLQSLLIATYEQAFALRQSKDYAAVAEKLEQAALIKPNDARVYYELAVAYARAGSKRKALSALSRAIEYGFTDVGRIERDPDLEQLRSDSDYQKLLARLKNKESRSQE